MEPGNRPHVFARWDGVHLVFDLPTVEDLLRDRLTRSEHLLDLRLEGRGDVVRVVARVVWKRIVSPVSLELYEFRIRHRHLGLRMRRLRVLGGVPIPRGAVESIIASLDQELVQVVRGEGIIIVDLQRWLPDAVDLSLLTVQATEVCLHLWIGPGGLREVPGRSRPQLPIGSEHQMGDGIA